MFYNTAAGELYVSLTSEKTEKGKVSSLLNHIAIVSNDSIHTSSVNKMLCWHS
jgi:hypothetical protein